MRGIKAKRLRRQSNHNQNLWDTMVWNDKYQMHESGAWYLRGTRALYKTFKQLYKARYK